jgi:predicted anti-sigma-YlaC factor YlaD
VPKSKVRKKSVYTPPEGVLQQSRARRARAAQPSPRWYAVLMVALMLIGLLWIVVYYVAGDRIPFLTSLGAWNFAIGFGAMVAGLIMSMRWR